MSEKPKSPCGRTRNGQIVHRVGCTCHPAPRRAPFTDGRNPAPETMAVDAQPRAGDARVRLHPVVGGTEILWVPASVSDED